MSAVYYKLSFYRWEVVDGKIKLEKWKNNLGSTMTGSFVDQQKPFF